MNKKIQALYKEELFTPEDVERMLNVLFRVINSMIKDPDSTIASTKSGALRELTGLELAG